jgi:NADPH-dependent glutamate synthase beta subunit-like oxidoreductase
VFAAGDARRGQSLIVWGINEGRQCARAVDRWLHGIGHEAEGADLVDLLAAGNR